ncbi:unnamed protein product [Prunus armeniaca]
MEERNLIMETLNNFVLPKVLFTASHVPIPHNKMALPSANIAILPTWGVPYFLLHIFLPHFGLRPFALLST